VRGGQRVLIPDAAMDFDINIQPPPGREMVKAIATLQPARLKDRKFVEVNPDNFDSVLANMKPHLAFSVENKLSEDPNAGNLKVNLDFKSMDDFSPENVARQVGPLRELLELRDRLRDLRGNMQGNDKLEEMLREAVTDKDKLAKLRTEMGVKEASNE